MKNKPISYNILYNSGDWKCWMGVNCEMFPEVPLIITKQVYPVKCVFVKLWWKMISFEQRAQGCQGLCTFWACVYRITSKVEEAAAIGIYNRCMECSVKALLVVGRQVKIVGSISPPVVRCPFSQSHCFWQDLLCTVFKWEHWLNVHALELSIVTAVPQNMNFSQ